ncbi:CotH kinase family protein [Hymenobacter cellulosilyticus]|uniref:CotH kinase family protein n=1 Tax=Hymenobacter cellulosilyticus TaxID=2932248 RepID=A0A8T9Q4L8_9BACT|nr:CotH kinase family protein [Hymenobacter cellulosilyticus]UOQ70838.1 CotH kinase family protein [Hymenobacter cellulosilyticus]
MPACAASFCGDTLTIAPTYYHIDKAKSLIVVNKNVADMNVGRRSATSHLLLDEVYSFAQAQTQLQTTGSYQVSRAGATYSVYFTTLPVVHISTKKQIVDTPSVYAQFSLSETNGTYTESNIGVEIRGAYSQTYPKKSFELSFWDDTTGAVSRDVSLLRMRTDNKWNLQAMYNEPLRLRSKVANEVWQDMHQVYYKTAEPEAKNGIAITYVELFLNEEYRGVYALSERIDRKQLKLKKYSNGIKGELYKGSDWGGAVTFTSLPPFDNTSETWGGFEYKHPEEEINWTNLYNLVDFVKNSSDEIFYRDYRKWFELNNAVDYYIFLNLTRATDNTGKNIYIAKYKTGEPYYYVPWDLDGVFGTNWLGQTSNTTDDILSNGLYDRLLQDCSPTGFRATLRKRWAELRAGTLTQERIMGKFAANHAYLVANNVYERESTTWPGFGFSSSDLVYTDGWLRNRLSYLDTVFSQPCSPLLAAAAAGPARSLKLYPNPAHDKLTLENSGAPAEVWIRDLQGRTVLQMRLPGGVNTLDVGHLAKGLYVATILSNQTLKTEKLLLN